MNTNTTDNLNIVLQFKFQAKTFFVCTLNLCSTVKTYWVNYFNHQFIGIGIYDYVYDVYSEVVLICIEAII